nr:MAG TPA: hypothetical protein [Caudoviricetes sp.]
MRRQTAMTIEEMRQSMTEAGVYSSRYRRKL